MFSSIDRGIIRVLDPSMDRMLSEEEKAVVARACRGRME